MSAIKYTSIVLVVVLLFSGITAVTVSAQEQGSENSTPGSSPENATTLEANTSITENISSGSEHWYKFDVQENPDDTLTITVENESKLAVYLYSANKVIESGFVSSNSTIELNASNESNTYYFYVRNERNTSETYTLKLDAELEADNESTTTPGDETTSPTETTIKSTTTEQTSNNQGETQHETSNGSRANESNSNPPANGSNSSENSSGSSIDDSSSQNDSSGSSGFLSIGIIPILAIIVLGGGTIVLCFALFY